MDALNPVASIHSDLDAIEAAVAEGRFDLFADLSESLGASLDAQSLRHVLFDDLDQAQRLNARLNRLGGVLGYMRALQQALQGLSRPDDEAYSAAAPAQAERRTATWEA